MSIDILINRLRIIPVLPGESSAKKKLTFLTELAGLGYIVDNPELFADSVLDNYNDIVTTLKNMKGGDVDYVPLFQGFPNKVPEGNEYFVKRIIGYLGNFIDLFEEGTELDNGMVVPDWLFDINEFGADPITQFQDETLYKKGIARQEKRARDTHTEWTHLKFVPDEEASHLALKYLQNVLYAKSSIQEALKSDIEYLLDYFGVAHIDPDKVVFKETKTYLTKYFWNKEDYVSTRRFIDTSTDLLRLFAVLTDSDISLAEKIKFPKFTKKQRSFVLGMIGNLSSPLEDMNKYRGLWLAVGRGLHPGEYINTFPEACAVFNTLRNGHVLTFNSKVEKAIEDRDIDALIKLLNARPGEFARKLHHLLEIAGKEYKKVLAHFEKIVDKVVLKNLLIMESYFSTIETSEYRPVINKKGRIIVLNNTQNRVEEKVIDTLVSLIKEAIERKIAQEKEPWNNKSVWVDSSLKKYNIPLQQRKVSDGLLSLGRGSRIPLDTGKVLRLFVYWKEKEIKTDLDLSVIEYDEHMKYIGHVSYTHLSGDGIVHSGDIQSAPCGAVEFIDLNLKEVKSRYIATQIYTYAGDIFANIQCHAGWMVREKSNKSRRSFDIKTVQNKFDLNGLSAYAIPIIIDLKEKEIIFIDLYVGKVSHHNRVEGAQRDISIISREMVRMNETRPNLYSLASYNVVGRNASLVEEKEKADITIGIDDCDYNVREVEKILSELI